MSFDEMLQKVLEIFPNAEVSEGIGGELIVSTQMQVDENDNIVEITED